LFRGRPVPEDNEINDDRQFGKPIMGQWKRKTKRYNIIITRGRRNGLKSNVKIVNDTDADSDDGCDTTVWQTARPIRPDCQNNDAALVQRYIGTIYDTVARARALVRIQDDKLNALIPVLFLNRNTNSNSDFLYLLKSMSCDDANFSFFLSRIKPFLLRSF